MPVASSLLLPAALLQEDLAVWTAGLLVTERQLSIGAALATLYVGVLTNNCAIYALGIGARRLPWLRRWLVGDKVERVRRRLERNLFATLMLCRFVPGVLSPTLLGCGWLGIPLARFLLAAALAAALYLPLMFTLVMVLGETVLRRLGEKAWIFLLALVLLTVVLGVCGGPFMSWYRQR